MYDLIKVKKLNTKKVIALVLILIILVIIVTLGIIKLIEQNMKKEYELTLRKQQELLAQQELARQQQEELERQQAIQNYINLTSVPLTEEQQDNILHVYRSTGEKRVFLTFDDGPSNSVTPLILDVLKEQNVKATFFVLGNNVNNNPDLIKREFEEGHYIANHGYSHRYSEIYSSPEATLAEYNTTEQAIRDALGNQSYRSNLFRFPGGSNGGYYHDAKQQSKAVLRENGVVHLDWNSLSKDAEGASTKESLLQNVIDTIGEKDSVVILMHDASDKILTYEMLPDLISYLREKGYKFQNIYDLL